MGEDEECCSLGGHLVAEVRVAELQVVLYEPLVLELARYAVPEDSAVGLDVFVGEGLGRHHREAPHKGLRVASARLIGPFAESLEFHDTEAAVEAAIGPSPLDMRAGHLYDFRIRLETLRAEARAFELATCRRLEGLVSSWTMEFCIGRLQCSQVGEYSQTALLVEDFNIGPFQGAGANVPGKSQGFSWSSGGWPSSSRSLRRSDAACLSESPWASSRSACIDSCSPGASSSGGGGGGDGGSSPQAAAAAKTTQRSPLSSGLIMSDIKLVEPRVEFEAPNVPTLLSSMMCSHAAACSKLDCSPPASPRVRSAGDATVLLASAQAGRDSRQESKVIAGVAAEDVGLQVVSHRERRPFVCCPSTILQQLGLPIGRPTQAGPQSRRRPCTDLPRPRWTEGPVFPGHDEDAWSVSVRLVPRMR